ncbi:MAG TPA: OmpA family protein, partial [Pseudomonadales bacterium]|nr:OmpA family protein [Pseudomonadales bacterium]
SAWSLYAKAGVSAIQNSANRIVAYEKVTSAQLALGAGVQRKLNDKWLVRAELEGFDKDAAYAGVSIARFWGSSERPAKPAPVPVVEEVKDSDGDGVKDPQDKCPNTPPGRKVNADGCEEQPAKVETIRLNVQFKTASADVEEKYLPEIGKVADFMKKYPDYDAVIEGHTDSVGKDGFNQKLSERRAASVREVLIKRFGIAANRISSVGYGKSVPIASNDTEAGRAQNRRVVAVLPR